MCGRLKNDTFDMPLGLKMKQMDTSIINIEKYIKNLDNAN